VVQAVAEVCCENSSFSERRERQGVSTPDLEWTFGWLAMIVDNQNQDDQNVAETRTAIVNNFITRAQKKKGTVQGRCLSGFEKLRGDAVQLKSS